MKRIAEPLRQFGAELICEGAGDRPPLTIRGTNLKAINFTSQVASAQVKSCVLLAALQASGKTIFTEPTLSRDHTERLFPAFGASLRNENKSLILHGPQLLEATELDVPVIFPLPLFGWFSRPACPDRN